MDELGGTGGGRSYVEEIQVGLGGRLQDLHARVQAGHYRALPSHRAYIPKADERLRPLWIASLEDKIVQRAVVKVLNDGGVPLLSHAFVGNNPDVTWFPTMLTELAARHRALTSGDMAVVFDAGGIARPTSPCYSAPGCTSSVRFRPVTAPTCSPYRPGTVARSTSTATPA